MPKIVRPPKTAGTNTYQTEVAAGAIAILDTEVDQDFKIVYDLVNGNIDDDNVSGSPKRIAYSKLDLTGKIQPSDLQSSPPFTLPGGVVLPPLTVDKTMMKVGAAWWAIQVSSSPGGAIGPTETVLSEFTYSSRGGICGIVAALNGNLVQTSAGSAAYEANLWMDGTPAVADGSQIGHATATAGLVGFNFSSGAEHFIPISTTLLGWNFGVPGFSPGVASTHRIKLSAKLTPATGVGYAGGITDARIYVLEPS